MSHFGWPQWVMIAFTAIVCIRALLNVDRSVGVAAVVVWAFLSWTLHMGGFY